MSIDDFRDAIHRRLPVDVIVTVIGGEQSARSILAGGGLVGTRSSATPPDGVPIEFIDWPFQLEDPSVEAHVDAVAEHEPRYAVAPDAEPGRSLDLVLDVAERLEPHVEHVIVVPKNVHPDAVPGRYRVGVPFRDGFETDLVRNTFPDFRGRPVHLLGGSPTDHFRLVDRHALDVQSVDTPTVLSWADFGRVWVARKRSADDVSQLLAERAIETSFDPERTRRFIRDRLLSIEGVPDDARDDTSNQLFARPEVRAFIRENPREFIRLIDAEHLQDASAGVEEAADVPSWASLLEFRSSRIQFSVMNIVQAWGGRRVTAPRAVEPGRGPPPPMDEPIEAFGETLSVEEQRERFMEATEEAELGRIEREERVPSIEEFRERMRDDG